ncbi:MAG: hypothetical protein ACKO37_08140 [Vampirovibrionales bacterium]
MTFSLSILKRKSRKSPSRVLWFAWGLMVLLMVSFRGVPLPTVEATTRETQGLTPVIAPVLSIPKPFNERMTSQPPLESGTQTTPETEALFITRGAWASVVCRYLGLPLQDTVQTMPVFPDVPLTHPQSLPILALWYRGWIRPVNQVHGVFSPELPLTYDAMWDTLARMILPKQPWLLQRLTACQLTQEVLLPEVIPSVLPLGSAQSTMLTPETWQRWQLLQQATCLPMSVSMIGQAVPVSEIQPTLQQAMPLSAKTTEMQERLERQRQANMPAVPLGVPLAVNPQQFISWKESVVGMPITFRLVKTIDLTPPMPLPTLTGQTQWLRRFPEGTLLQATYTGEPEVFRPPSQAQEHVGCFVLHHMMLQAERATLPMHATLCVTYKSASSILKEQTQAYKRRHHREKLPANQLTLTKEDTAFFRLDQELSGTFRDDFWVIPDTTYYVTTETVPPAGGVSKATHFLGSPSDVAP